MVTEYDLLEKDPSELDESDLESFHSNAVVTSTDWTTETILSQLKRGNIELSPFFQRREAWNDEVKSRFIESLFLGLPVPQIVLAERINRNGSYIVIDGKQRLLAIRRFAAEGASDMFEPLRLTPLTHIPELSGRTWEEIKEDSTLHDLINSYENQTVRTVVVKNYPNEAFLYLLFLRLNTGSLPLSTQELRQALHPGPFTDFVVSHSADSTSIQRALGIEAPDFRMRDVELLIRYFAFAESLHIYRGNLKEFLDNASRDLNIAWPTRETEIQMIASQCDKAIDTTVAVFGLDAFRRWRAPGGFIGRFNRAVFDVMTYYFRQPEIAAEAQRQGVEVKEAFMNLCDVDSRFSEALQTTTKSTRSTFYRIIQWGEALKSVLPCEVIIPTSPVQL